MGGHNNFFYGFQGPWLKVASGTSPDSPQVPQRHQNGAWGVALEGQTDTVWEKIRIEIGRFAGWWVYLGQKEEIYERIKIFSPFQVNSAQVKNAKDDYFLCIAYQQNAGEK